MMDKGPLRRSDFITALILIIFGVWVLSTTVTTFPMKDSWGGVQNVWYVSPALFPIFISVGIMILGIILLLNAIKEGGAQGFIQRLAHVKIGISENMLRFLAIVLVFVVYVYLHIPRIDFFLSTMFCLTVFITMYYLDYGALLKQFTIFYAVGSLIFVILFAVGADTFLNSNLTDLFIEKLTLNFQDDAFASAEAEEVKNSEYDLYLNFSDPTLIYSDNRFKEAEANDGTIAEDPPVIITVSGDTLTGENGEDFAAAGKVKTNLDKVAPGLTAVLTRMSNTELRVALTGQAQKHMNEHDVDQLTFTFQNEAFASGNARKFANVQKDLLIDFKDPVMEYTTKVFQEAPANDGTFEADNPLIITLQGDTFTGEDGEDFIASKKARTNVTRLAPGLGMTAIRTSATEVRVALTGRASQHANANDVESVMLRFQDKAFATSKADQVEDAHKNDLQIDFADPVLTYSLTELREVVADDGTIDNSPPFTITLNGDTFTGKDGEDFVAAGKVATNLQEVAPGLTVVLTRTSATELHATFTGSAQRHADENDVKNLTLTFKDTAFASGNAQNVVDAVKDDLHIDFIEIALSYSKSEFEEADANDGSIEKPINVTLTGDTLTGSDGEDFVATGKVETNIEAVAPGLTAVVTRTGPKDVLVELQGNALQHADRDDVDNLSITFSDAAFTSGNASGLGNSTKSDLRIDFADPSLAFLKRTFKEADANDGTIDNRKPLEIRLAGDVFRGEDGEDFVNTDKLVTNLDQVAPGLRAVATRSGSTEILVTLEGTATAHNSADDVNNLTFTFQDTAFASGRAASVENSTINDLRILFSNPVLSYSAKGFQEADDSGKIEQTVPFVITLSGDTFSGSEGEDFVASGKVKTNISAVAAGLTPVFTRQSPTEIHVTLTGQAKHHANVDDVKNLTFLFQDSAFVSGNADIVVNAEKDNFQIDFTDRALKYSKTGFKEAIANDGTLDVSKPLKVSLSGDQFTGEDGENFVAASKLKTNLPEVAPGLKAVATRLSPNELEVIFTGAATQHANADDVFMKGAFRYSMDILLFLFFLSYVYFCWKNIRPLSEELHAKYLMALVVSIAVPFFVIPLFKYALLVPFPVEGGGIEIMNILWYSPTIRSLRRMTGDYIFLVGVFLIFVAIIVGIYFKFMRKVRQ